MGWGCSRAHILQKASCQSFSLKPSHISFLTRGKTQKGSSGPHLAPEQNGGCYHLVSLTLTAGAPAQLKHLMKQGSSLALGSQGPAHLPGPFRGPMTAFPSSSKEKEILFCTPNNLWPQFPRYWTLLILSAATNNVTQNHILHADDQKSQLTTFSFLQRGHVQLLRLLFQAREHMPSLQPFARRFLNRQHASGPRARSRELPCEGRREHTPALTRYSSALPLPCTAPYVHAVSPAKTCEPLPGQRLQHCTKRAWTWSNFQYHTSASWPGQQGTCCTDMFGLTSDRSKQGQKKV